MLPRPSVLLALLTILGVLTSHAAVAADGPSTGGVPTPAASSPEACRGVAVERFEQGLPADTRRYPVGAHLAPPFAELWDKARRPELRAAVPDAVTVYARGSQPLLIAYRTGGCVLAVVTLPRDRLWRVLRKELGQSV